MFLIKMDMFHDAVCKENVCYVYMHARFGTGIVYDSRAPLNESMDSSPILAAAGDWHCEDRSWYQPSATSLVVFFLFWLLHTRCMSVKVVRNYGRVKRRMVVERV